MISQVFIQGLKGIGRCNIPELGKINVFIGKNDTCKSTILEAIYYTLKEFRVSSLWQVIGRRTNVPFGGQELWFNYETGKNISVTLGLLNTIALGMEIQYVKAGTADFQVQSLVEVEETGIEKTAPGIQTSIYSSDLSRITRTSYGEKHLDNLSNKNRKIIANFIDNCRFLDSSEKNDVEAMEKLLGDVKLEGKEYEFGKYLNEVFKKGQKFEFLPHPVKRKEFRVAFTNGKPLFLSGMGDGIRFAIQIIGSGLISKSTCILIEEIESNQHPGSLRRLIDFLMEIAFENQLQLFITTHNPLAIRWIWYHFRATEGKEDKRASKVKFFHVTREEETGKVECKSIDIHNAADYNQLEGDIFELEEVR